MRTAAYSCSVWDAKDWKTIHDLNCSREHGIVEPWTLCKLNMQIWWDLVILLINFKFNLEHAKHETRSNFEAIPFNETFVRMMLHLRFEKTIRAKKCGHFLVGILYERAAMNLNRFVCFGIKCNCGKHEHLVAENK